MADTVVELFTFRLKPGVSEEDFRQIAIRSQTIIGAQPGFIRRELVLSRETGVWSDILYWETSASAIAALLAFTKSSEAPTFAAAVDEHGQSLTYSDIISLGPIPWWEKLCDFLRKTFG